jgi:two-component system nitrate/nitrite response regulator NarL
MAVAEPAIKNRLRVLICDDDAGFVEALRATLEGEPELEVAGVARDGLEALELADSLAPLDVILLDIEMPRMDGIQTLAALRKARESAALVMLTGVEEHDVIRQARRSGPDGFLLKSVEPDEIINGILIIGHLCRNARASRARS